MHIYVFFFISFSILAHLYQSICDLAFSFKYDINLSQVSTLLNVLKFSQSLQAICCYLLFRVVCKQKCEVNWAVAAAAKSLQLSDSVRTHRRQPTRLPCPWDSLGKNTGVNCHFLLQSMKMKSESEVAQLCLTLHDPMDCSLPGSSFHGIFQARVLEWVAIELKRQRIHLCELP